MKKSLRRSLLVHLAYFYGGCECLPFLQDEPGIKYLWGEGIARKGSSLAAGLSLSRYTVSMEKNSRCGAPWPSAMVLSVALCLRVSEQVQTHGRREWLHSCCQISEISLHPWVWTHSTLPVLTHSGSTVPHVLPLLLNIKMRWNDTKWN